MSSKKVNGKLVIPALRAHMGDWVYYVAFLRMRDIADRVHLAEEVHTSKSLNELMQRGVTKRATQIKDYLLSKPQRFFNSLVIGVYGGSPQWYELAIKENKDLNLEDLPNYIKGALGILILEGTEKLFAIDGQHRVVGIKEAVKESSKVGEEEISAIFVAHNKSRQGLERTRRLFTTLNRYAKPVDKRDVIALDEDDIIAIITRKIVEEHPLFHEKTSVKQVKSIPPTDSHCLTTIVALYDALDIYLRNKKQGWDKFKKSRPSDTEIAEFFNKASSMWDIMIKYFPPLKKLKDSDPTKNVAGKYRNTGGGHLLFRPVGLLVIMKVVRHLIDSGISLDKAVQRTSRAPMNIANEPWIGLLWDATNLRMITRSENQKVGVKLLFNAIGGDLSRLRTDEKKLIKEFAGLLNKDPKSVTLPRYIRAK